MADLANSPARIASLSEATGLNERLFRRALVSIAVAGLLLGLLAWGLGRTDLANWCWAVGTAPVVIGLLISMIRDFLAGRVGVDAVAFVSMSGALALGQNLAGIVIAVMYAGGNILEDFAVARAERDLRSLIDRAPKIAHRRIQSVIEDVPIEQVAVGDSILVRAGEVIPVDGVIVSSIAILDEAAVTGEPIPVNRQVGERARSGSVNAGETFELRASTTASESTYAGIVRMVSAAQTAKAPFVRMADRYALLLLPVTLVTAGGAWWVSGDPIRALAVLVASTPCPLILAAPVAFIAGVAARDDGLRARGRRRWAIRAGRIAPDGLWRRQAGEMVGASFAASVLAFGASIFVAVDGRTIGAILLADELRRETPRAVQALRAGGVSRIVMVTGDRAEAAETIGAALDLDAVLWDREPADKVDAVAAEQRQHPTVMVGDGINDAPALAAANVGVAMGARGASASSEAADVVILVDRLDRVSEAITIAKRTHRIALQSIIAGMGMSALAMGFAAVGYLPPIAGALTQEVIDVAVILNALRALSPGRKSIRRKMPEGAGASLHQDHERVEAALDHLREIADALDHSELGSCGEADLRGGPARRADRQARTRGRKRRLPGGRQISGRSSWIGGDEQSTPGDHPPGAAPSKARRWPLFRRNRSVLDQGRTAHHRIDRGPCAHPQCSRRGHL